MVHEPCTRPLPGRRTSEQPDDNTMLPCFVVIPPKSAAINYCLMCMVVMKYIQSRRSHRRAAEGDASTTRLDVGLMCKWRGRACPLMAACIWWQDFLHDHLDRLRQVVIFVSLVRTVQLPSRANRIKENIAAWRLHGEDCAPLTCSTSRFRYTVLDVLSSLLIDPTKYTVVSFHNLINLLSLIVDLPPWCPCQNIKNTAPLVSFLFWKCFWQSTIVSSFVHI